MCRLIIVAFEQLNEVVIACFGKNISTAYEQRLFDFRSALNGLDDFSQTPKIHMILDHVDHHMAIHGSLEIVSEYAFESIHAYFDKQYENFKVSEANPEYLQKFFDAVVSFNSFRFLTPLNKQQCQFDNKC